MSTFLFIYFLFILGLQIIIIPFFLIIHIKFRINIWLHCDELDFYHSYQQIKMKSENNLQNKINS